MEKHVLVKKMFTNGLNMFATSPTQKGFFYIQINGMFLVIEKIVDFDYETYIYLNKFQHWSEN